MLRQRLSQWFRSRRNALLRRVIAAAPRKGAELRILDVGGRADYWERLGLDFLHQQNARVVILNRSTDELRILDSGSDRLAYAVGDGCALDYADDSFDLCHSNSVIEHVGQAQDMERFAAETRRVAPSYFVQTPNLTPEEFAALTACGRDTAARMPSCRPFTSVSLRCIGRQR